MLALPQTLLCFLLGSSAAVASAPSQEPIPPVREVREAIRQVLREELLNEEIERWTDELRRDADVVDYFDREQRDLPPVVHQVGG